MLRDEVAPALRALGFRGSGQNFSLASETHWALLGFQKSAWSHVDGVRFTVNLVVVARDAWAKARESLPELPERPGANWGISPVMESAFEGGYWNERIGKLMPEGLDHWWDVEAGEDPTPVAQAVVAAVRDYALPAIWQRIR